MNKTVILSILVGMLVACQTNKKIDGVLLINHLGYQKDAYKSAVYQSKDLRAPAKYVIVNEQNEDVYSGVFESGGQVDNWHTGRAYRAVFTAFNKVGTYALIALVDGQKVASHPFEIMAEPMGTNVLPLLTKAFQLQRCKPPYDDKDKKMSFFGERDDIVDVSGGWYDASGEKGKYLSHLSFSNYMTPQQLPMMVWNMLEAIDVLNKTPVKNKAQISDELGVEAAFGADYLVRIQDDKGYFYATVFAGWTKDPEQRQICAYEGQDGQRNDKYQAAFREGGGMAIAALARSFSKGISGEFSSKTYLEVAEKAFAHLKANNLKYCDDEKENIIDDYCALMAATELYKATNNENYLADARQRARALEGRSMNQGAVKGWLRVDDSGQRPYFHGAEAGLPVIAMGRYLSIESEEERTKSVKAFINQSICFEIAVTNEVTNPFGYARQYVKAVDEEQSRTAFFLPHANETGYWWQGENARLASLATAMFMAQDVLEEDLQAKAKAYAAEQINWVFGLNPYNVCMLHGAGRNNPDYKEDGKSMNYLGGICNGITGGFDDESDIAFRPLPYDKDPAQRWRWSEQWLQHGGWMIPAIAYSAVYN
ncbi:glycoside hydrolase family 9 protein [Carboxylicivirga marina]|uniref:Glycoside hydrolase family 9 protein n=1 Tax=Carboxylicivirga marina TaxID=2800988 RepID=A0ABS1HLC5_9BACT|nr:glycoside hydrolase family 9 protein [Carboxylicivirga marina]MBK3518468.1 glycoside hydrolase family 9 protein [Carboxylicivirga marina]